jgi:hypothetical protein
LNKETKQVQIFTSKNQETFPNIMDIIYYQNFGQKLIFKPENDPELLLLCPDVNFRLTRIRNSGVKSRATDLTLRLLNKETSAFGSLCFGYFTTDLSKKVIPIPYNDPERFEFPLCGLWIYGIKYESNLFENSKYIKQIIWGLASHFLRDSRFEPRLSLESGKCVFLFILFFKGENPKVFTLEKLDDNQNSADKLKMSRHKINLSSSLITKSKGKWVSLDYEREIVNHIQLSTEKIMNRKQPLTLKTTTAISISDQTSPFCIYNGQNMRTKDNDLMIRSNPEKQDFLFSSSNCEKCLKNTSLTSPKGKIEKHERGTCSHKEREHITPSSDVNLKYVKDKYKNVNSNSLQFVDSCNSKTFKDNEFSEREKYLIQNLEKQMELTTQNDRYYKGMIEKMQTQIDMLTKCLFNINTSLSRISENPSFRDHDESSYFPGLSAFDVHSTTNNQRKGKIVDKILKPVKDGFLDERFHIVKENEAEGILKMNEGKIQRYNDKTIEILDQTGTEAFQSINNKENENFQNFPKEEKNRNFKKVLIEFEEQKIKSKTNEEKKQTKMQEKAEIEEVFDTKIAIKTIEKGPKFKEIEDLTISLSEDKSLSTTTLLKSSKQANNSENEEEQLNYLKIIEENRKNTEAGEGNSNNFSIQVPKISDKYKHMLDEEFWETPNEE